MFEPRLFAAAERFLINATADERQELARIIDQILCYDPWIDNKTKIAFPLPPAILTLYADGKYWIMYHVVKNTEIRIWNIGYAHEPPKPFRDDD